MQSHIQLHQDTITEDCTSLSGEKHDAHVFTDGSVLIIGEDEFAFNSVEEAQGSYLPHQGAGDEELRAWLESNRGYGMR